MNAPEPAQVLAALEPRRDFFVGIDSDGCAFDTMDIKHLECFIPATIRGWGLQPVSTLARETWALVNLASVLRGCNRWVGLVTTFALLRNRPEVAERGMTIPDVSELVDFVHSGLPLSDQGLAEFAGGRPSPTVERAMRWSNAINVAIKDTVRNCPPWPGVRQALADLQPVADCVTVSATPIEALEREWAEHQLASQVRAIAGQEMGPKSEQLRLATDGRYERGRIILLGDAPGDQDAAKAAGCAFYPVVRGREIESWRRFRDEALGRFLSGTYEGPYESGLIDEFRAALATDVPWVTVSGHTEVVAP